MRIGIFSDTYPPYINGVSTSIRMLQCALEKEGHQVFIVTVNPEHMEYKYEENNKVIRLPGIPIGIYDYRLTGIYPVRVINKIKDWDLDVIHSHTEFGVGTFARIIAKQLDLPLVHTYHTMYEDYVHYITKGYFNGASKKIVEYLTKFYCDKTATELIVPTQKAYDLFKEKYKVERNVHIIPTGIEMERFYQENFKKEEIYALRTSLGIQPSDFIILFVGRLGEEKSVDVLIEGQASLVKKFPNCKLLIVGDGPDATKYHQMVKKFKIEDHVIFTGKVPWEMVPKYYQLAHLFATASKTETQGLTVIEALAASVPVLAFNDESFRNVIIEGENGVLFDNKKQYRKKMEDLLEHPDIIGSMKSRTRKSVEPFSSKYFAQKVLDVYKCAIEKKGGMKKRSFVGRLKNVVRSGFYGK